MSKLIKKLQTELEQSIINTLKNHRLTIHVLEAFYPCYYPDIGVTKVINERVLGKKYNASLLDFLQHPEVPYSYKAWFLQQFNTSIPLALHAYSLWGLEVKSCWGSGLLTDEAVLIKPFKRLK